MAILKRRQEVRERFGYEEFYWLAVNRSTGLLNLDTHQIVVFGKIH